MNDKIIERLLEVNEKRSKASDIKFYIAAVLLLLSLLGNIYQATQTGEIIVESNPLFEQSDNNINKVSGK